jgi:3-hydroxy-9,10-secoandrosta-1,3,5(10)-triene-9,17-dione monooxygenase
MANAEVSGSVDKGSVDKQQVLAAVREKRDLFRSEAEVGDDARHLPDDSVAAMIDIGLPSVLVPSRFGGHELGVDTWFEATREVARADAAHGWCAGLLMHVGHMLTYFPDEAQAAVWGDGPNVPLAGSVLPVAQVAEEDGGFRVTAKSPFTSGVNHAQWVFVGGFLKGEGPPRWLFFLIPPGEYEVLDTWQTLGMRGTGSNTIAVEDFFVPREHTLAVEDMIEGRSATAELNQSPIYRLPFTSYSSLGFVGTMLGAAEGALEALTAALTEKRTPVGARVAEGQSVQMRLGETAARLGAAELLLQRIAEAAGNGEAPDLEDRARAMRDAALASKLIVDAVDEMVSLSGTSGFATANPIQRVWRDVHFASAHISLNPEINYAHWARQQLDVERPPTLLIF